jgi:hemerythrin superfamily protein
MDAIDLIKHDHREIDELFARFLEVESGMTQDDVFQQIQTRLNTHTEMEERFFYPVMRQFAADKVEESLKEHSQIKEILGRLVDTDLDEESCEKCFTELRHDVRQHVEEEESPQGILELARTHLSEGQLMEMAAAMETLMQRGHEDLAA